MSGALGGKLGKKLRACTSLVGAGLCEVLRVFHLGGGEALPDRRPR